MTTPLVTNFYAGQPQPESRTGAALVSRVNATDPHQRAESNGEQQDKTYSGETNEQLIARMRMLFREARHHRSPIIPNWNRAHAVMQNRTWTQRLSYYPAPEVPEIVPIIESLVGWQTDQRPTFEVMPSAPMHTDYWNWQRSLADDLRVALQVNWIEHDHEAVIELVCRDAYIYGTGILKTIWDNTLIDGMGDARFRRVDPYTIYPDPNATSLEDANYIIEASNISLQELDRRFPGAGKLVSQSLYKEDIDIRPDPLRGSSEAPKANPGGYNGASGRYGLPGQGRTSIQQMDGVTVLECWIREHYVSGEDTDESPLVIHDEWRCIVICGGHILLNKAAKDLWASHRCHPYDRYVAQERGEFWGASLVDQLRPLQETINRLIAASLHHTELTANPPLLEDAGANIQRTRITNLPGQRITKSPGREVAWLQAPPIRSDITGWITFLIGEMERISGLTAINRGIGPGGRNAASVIESIQEASFVRVRMASRQLERTLRSVGMKLASLMTEFYLEDRLIALVGRNGERTSRTLKSRHWYVPTSSNDDNDIGRTIPFRFQLQINAGSTLPTSRQARTAEADFLYGVQAIDRIAVLQAHDWPGAQEIAARMDAMDQQLAASQGPTSREATRPTSPTL